MRNNCCLMCVKKITTSISAHLMSRCLNPLESCYIQASIKTEFSSFSDATLFYRQSAKPEPLIIIIIRSLFFFSIR